MAATSNSINMSLDDIITQNRANRKAGASVAAGVTLGPDGLPRAPRADRPQSQRGARRGARSDRSQGRNTPYAGANPRVGGASGGANVSVAAAAAQLGQATLNVSNLNHNITQQDFNELFSTIGPVKSAVLNFDQHGRSKGTGTVVYRQKGDTQRAINEFNGRQFDGRPMRIELIVSASSLASFAARAAPAAGHQAQRGAGGRGAARGRGGAQRGGRGGRGPKGPAKTPEELAAQLDAEMDKYMQSQDGSGDAVMSL
ncbi:hypothetical protein HDU79_011806 [Rhizoclosmatium sp. JEL0117]|nr:hypothetical protein HDU79_011806 [Rhizoclosmatium sp. JEL0117]